MNQILLTAALLTLAAPAFAADHDLAKIIPNPQFGLEWPVPTADEAVRLPADGCKTEIEVSKLRGTAKGPQLMEFLKSADGKCYSWYKRKLLEVKVVDEAAAAEAKAALDRGEMPKPQ